MRVKFHPEARADLKQGNAFYRQRSPLAAIAFAHQIDAALTRIAQAPLRYPEVEHGTREHVLPSRFPYTIVYRVHQKDHRDRRRCSSKPRAGVLAQPAVACDAFLRGSSER